MPPQWYPGVSMAAESGPRVRQDAVIVQLPSTRRGAAGRRRSPGAGSTVRRAPSCQRPNGRTPGAAARRPRRRTTRRTTRPLRHRRLPSQELMARDCERLVWLRPDHGGDHSSLSAAGRGSRCCVRERAGGPVTVPRITRRAATGNALNVSLSFGDGRLLCTGRTFGRAAYCRRRPTLIHGMIAPARVASAGLTGETLVHLLAGASALMVHSPRSCSSTSAPWSLCSGRPADRAHPPRRLRSSHGRVAWNNDRRVRRAPAPIGAYNTPTCRFGVHVSLLLSGSARVSAAGASLEDCRGDDAVTHVTPAALVAPVVRLSRRLTAAPASDLALAANLLPAPPEE